MSSQVTGGEGGALLYLYHLLLRPDLGAEGRVLAHKIPRHPQHPLRAIDPQERRMVEAHHVPDLDSLPVLVQPRHQEIVAPDAEGGVHGGPLGQLHGEEVFGDQREGAEDAQAVEAEAEHGAGRRPPQALS